MPANLHPISVHFPIAFLFLAGGLYLYHAYKGEDFHFRMAKFLHLFGLGALVLAMLSGRMAASEIEADSPMTDLVRNHELFGYGSIWAFSMLFLWIYLREKSIKKQESWVFGGVYFLFLLVLGYSSSLGGEIAHPI